MEGDDGDQAVHVHVAGLDDAGDDDDAQRGDAVESAAAVGADSQHSSSSSALPSGQRQQPAPAASGQVQTRQLSDMRVDTIFGYGGGQVSPASDFRRGSMSPGLPPEGRYASIST